MDIRKELHAVLSSKVVDNVYPLLMPQDMKRDAIVYSFIGNRDTTGVTCVDPVDTKYMVQIDVFASTYANSVSLMELVKNAVRNNFVVSGMTSFETYENITLKYRQIINLSLGVKNGSR